MKKALIVIVVIAAAAGLSGCGETFEQRLDLRQKCEAAGGVFHDWFNGVGVSDPRCVLDSPGVDE